MFKDTPNGRLYLLERSLRGTDFFMQIYSEKPPFKPFDGMYRVVDRERGNPAIADQWLNDRFTFPINEPFKFKTKKTTIIKTVSEVYE